MHPLCLGEVVWGEGSRGETGEGARMVGCVLRATEALQDWGRDRICSGCSNCRGGWTAKQSRRQLGTGTSGRLEGVHGHGGWWLPPRGSIFALCYSLLNNRDVFICLKVRLGLMAIVLVIFLNIDNTDWEG